MLTKTKCLKYLMLITVVFSLFMTTLVNAKSLYVIDNINQSPSPVSAFDIQPGGTLVYQATYGITYRGGGAVGIALDSDNGFLFITYEFENTMQLVDATTMLGIGTTTAPGASNLAGIVYDHDNQKVYTVDRYTTSLYSYSWNPSTKVLTLDSGFPISLPVTQFYGLSLDEGNDWLFVGDATNTIKYFNTGSWTLAGTITLGHYVTDVAVDEKRGFVYSGHWASAAGGYSNRLSKYDMNTNTETYVTLSSQGFGSYEEVFGVEVDDSTGVVYVTTGYGYDRLLVFDSNLNPLQDLGDRGNPTGLVVPTEDVSYNPLSLDKDDGLTVDVLPGGSITYTISYDNSLNTYQVNNVELVDYLPPEVDFDSATGGGVYDSGTHSVTWTLGTIPAGAPLASVTLTVTVDPSTAPGTTLDNSVTINSDETPPTTKHEYTDVGTPSQKAPMVESSDSGGTVKDKFILDETVYAIGSGYNPTTTYDLYIVEDVTWTNGMAIPTAIISTTVTSDGSGDVNPTSIWAPFLTVGYYDIIVDVNDDGLYTQGVDAIDDVSITYAQGTSGFFVIPEIPLGTLLGLITCLSALALHNSKRKML